MVKLDALNQPFGNPTIAGEAIESPHEAIGYGRSSGATPMAQGLRQSPLGRSSPVDPPEHSAQDDYR